MGSLSLCVVAVQLRTRTQLVVATAITRIALLESISRMVAWGGSCAATKIHTGRELLQPLSALRHPFNDGGERRYVFLPPSCLCGSRMRLAHTGDTVRERRGRSAKDERRERTSTASAEPSSFRTDGTARRRGPSEPISPTVVARARWRRCIRCTAAFAATREGDADTEPAPSCAPNKVRRQQLKSGGWRVPSRPQWRRCPTQMRRRRRTIRVQRCARG